MVGNSNCLMDYVEFASPRPIILGDSTHISALGKGTLVVKSLIDGKVAYAPFCNTLLWTRVESAEMVKHALNSYLATCITFTNEIANICEDVSADMREVGSILKEKKA